MSRVKLYGMLLLLTSVPNTFVFGATDIAGHWAEKTMIEWQNKGKISGYEDDTFRPNASITRAEFIHLLNSIVSLENGGAIHFDDVAETDWFYQDVIKAAGSHIIAGFEDNTFRPNEMVTRAQAALIIKNVLQLSDNAVSAPFIDDAEIPDWAKSAVYTMLHTGYLSGYEDGSFAPNKGMTRAEAISMLDRIEKNTNETILNTNQNTNEINQNTIQNEISQNVENHSQDTIWKNGDSGSSYKSNKGKEEEKEEKAEKKSEITITKDNVADFYGKTLEDNIIFVLDDDGMELLDMTLNGKVEVISEKTLPTEQANTIPTLFLKGSTKIKDITISTPIIIKSENNIIENMTVAESITIRDTNVIHLNCLNNTEKEEHTICISLQGNTNCNIAISESVIVETIHLSEQAQANIVNKGEIKEIISFSQYVGTTITNHGIINSLIALKPESITAENVVVEPAILQNITVLSQPSQLYYKEGNPFSLSGISLFLQYQNDITKVVDDTMFSLYHIQTFPANNAILTAKEDKKPVIISGDTVSVTGGILAIEYNKKTEDTENVENKVDTTALSKLIQDCKVILENTTISDTGKEIAFMEWYIDEADFHLLETEIMVSEQLLLKPGITQNDVQQQYDKLLSSLQNFEQKRISQVTIQPPVLSVSNKEPAYDENVIFSIEKKENTEYYYTLDGSEPNTESTEYTEEVTLFHPDDNNVVVIKAIAVENEVSSAVTEVKIIYPTVIEHISFLGLEMPSIGKEVFPISLEETTACEIEEVHWKDGKTEVERFDWETVYSVDITLKANKNYFFEKPILKNIPEEKITNAIVENISADKLHILLTFKATPPEPTQEIAKEKIKELMGLSILVDASKIQNEEYCLQAVLENIQEKIGEYWEVTCEQKIFIVFGSESVFSGTFNITSTIDDSISFLSDKIDIIIKADSDREE